jgi:DHA1 family inner membrane transport protein
MTEISTARRGGREGVVAPHGRGLAEFALTVGGFGIGTGEFAIMGLLPDVAANLHVSVPHAGHLISAYALGVVVGAPVISVFCARMARHRLLIGLMLLFAAGNLLSALSHQYGTILLFRFLTGLPHGAYFGIAALVAASMVDPGERARAVGRVMLGITAATVIGAPFATWCGQYLDWRAAYFVVAGIGALAVGLLFLFLPRLPVAEDASPLTELGALRRLQVWLALATGAVGFGGLFAVYSYISPALIQRAGVAPALVPVVLAVLGLGMAAGNTIVARFADKALRVTIVVLLLWDAAACALFVPAIRSGWAATADAFLIGVGVALAPALQTRLMDVAADAQALAASLNHSAFNIANALGAWLGGLAIAAGYGWQSPGWVGALLALGGLAIFGMAMAAEEKNLLTA